MIATLRMALLAGTVLSVAGTHTPAHADVMTAEAAAYRAPVLEVAAAAGRRDGMPEDVLQSLHCAMLGSAATALAASVGPENLINLIAGGVVPFASNGALYIGLVGVVFASFCQIGQALTPVYLYLVDPPPRPAAPAERVADAAPTVNAAARSAIDLGIMPTALKHPPLPALPSLRPWRTTVETKGPAGGTASGISSLVAALR